MVFYYITMAGLRGTPAHKVHNFIFFQMVGYFSHLISEFNIENIHFCEMNKIFLNGFFSGCYHMFCQCAFRNMRIWISQHRWSPTVEVMRSGLVLPFVYNINSIFYAAFFHCNCSIISFVTFLQPCVPFHGNGSIARTSSYTWRYKRLVIIFTVPSFFFF